MKDGSHLYEVERRAEHAARPGFRINELQLSPTQQVPWHLHTHIQDTFYVLAGEVRLFLREPKEEVRLGPGDAPAGGRPGKAISPGWSAVSSYQPQTVTVSNVIPAGPGRPWPERPHQRLQVPAS